MPIIRYVLFAGAFVIALLFALDRHLPPLEAVSAGTDVDRSIIRIHSARAVPEKIIFDTSSGIAAMTAAPAHAAELPRPAAGDAFAMAEPQKQQLKITPPPQQGVTRGAGHHPKRTARTAFSRRPSDRQAMVGAF